MSAYQKVTLHRDGSVTLWSVYHQRWVRVMFPGDSELAAMAVLERLRALKHLRRHRLLRAGVWGESAHYRAAEAACGGEA